MASASNETAGRIRGRLGGGAGGATREGATGERRERRDATHLGEVPRYLLRRPLEKRQQRQHLRRKTPQWRQGRAGWGSGREGQPQGSDNGASFAPEIPPGTGETGRHMHRETHLFFVGLGAAVRRALPQQRRQLRRAELEQLAHVGRDQLHGVADDDVDQGLCDVGGGEGEGEIWERGP